MKHVMPTAAGSRPTYNPLPLVIPADPGQTLAFARWADRRADWALAEGRSVEAERLSHAAYEARCRAGMAP